MYCLRCPGFEVESSLFNSRTDLGMTGYILLVEAMKAYPLDFIMV